MIAVAGNVYMDGKVEIDEMMRPRMLRGDVTVSEYTVEQRRQHLLLYEECEKLGELL